MLSKLIAHVEQRQQWVRGESILREQLAMPANREQTKWLTQQLYQLYHEAIKQNGEVSLGRGQTLYRGAGAEYRQGVGYARSADRRRSGEPAVRHTTARRKLGYAGVTDDVRRFIAEQVPKVIKHQPAIARLRRFPGRRGVARRSPPRDAVLFLIQQIENEPASLQYIGQDTWSGCSQSLAKWRGRRRTSATSKSRLLPS